MSRLDIKKLQYPNIDVWPPDVKLFYNYLQNKLFYKTLHVRFFLYLCIVVEKDDIHKSEFFSTVGNLIKEARLKSGMHQHALAQKLNISRVSLINIEKGRHNASLYMLYEIAYHLQINITELLPLMNQFVKNFKESIPMEVFNVSELKQAEGTAYVDQEEVFKSVEQFLKTFNKTDESSNS